MGIRPKSWYWWIAEEKRRLAKVVQARAAIVAVPFGHAALRLRPGVAAHLGGVDDEIRPLERLRAVGGLGKAQARTQLIRKALCQASNHVQPMPVDIHKRHTRSMKSGIDAQIADDPARKLGAARANDGDFDVS